MIVSDIKMPGMDGIEFFRAVATKRYEIQPCFVLVTGHAGQLLDRVPYADRKMLGMLRKPFSPLELIERVRQFAAVAEMKRSSATLKAVIGGHK